MSTKNLSNEELELQLGKWIQQEVQSTSQIIVLIAEADRRLLHLERGFPTLLSWLVETYKYSEQAAQRRIQAAKFCSAVPEVAMKIEAGDVTLTSIVKAQSVIRTQEKMTGEKVSFKMKEQILGDLEGRSTKQAEQVLSAYFPEAAKTVAKYKFESELSEENQKLFARIKEMHSHAIPDGDLNQVLKRVFEEHLKRHDPLKKQANFAAVKRRVIKGSPEGRHSNTRTSLQPIRKAVSSPLKRKLIQEANACCSYQDPVTKRICGSRYQLEIDHIKPLAMGGSDDASNLRCLCRQHNKLMAIKNLGQEKMARYFG